MSKLVLYHNNMSSCSQKVRLVLYEKNLTWTEKHLNIREGASRTYKYLKINPNGVVPTLIHDDRIIIESTVIMEYLDDVFPLISLKSSTPFLIAKMRLWNKKLDEGMHSHLSIISSAIAFRHQFLKNKTEKQINENINNIPDLGRREKIRDTIFNGLKSKLFPNAIVSFYKLFKEMDEYLSENEWLGSENYSLADAAYTPYLIRFEHLNLFLMFQERKNLKNWLKRIKEKKNFEDAITRRLDKSYLQLMSEKGLEVRKEINKLVNI